MSEALLDKPLVKSAIGRKKNWLVKSLAVTAGIAAGVVVFPEIASAIGTEKVDLAIGYVAFGAEPLKYYNASLSWVSYSAGTAVVLASARGAMGYIIGTIRAAIASG